LVVTDLPHRVGYFPGIAHVSILGRGGLAGGFVKVLALAHVDEELHFVFLVLLGNDECAETEFWFDLYYFHVFWQLFLPLHLAQVLVVLVLVLGVGDFHHVLVEETHELGLLEGTFYFFEVIAGEVVELEVALLGTIHLNDFKYL
jgi:hypothetical protein